ncbi:hypothetical protein Glove_261g93 [Diversispora epigaea]|uniref:SAM domain-containing protein n=1 Tax=Diversispora epigaea TaxID=1348612 RepID=A0A397I833_9GLOM|nr:hypothetical protein Glove_261g93 [Diversispora epigaea]
MSSEPASPSSIYSDEEIITHNDDFGILRKQKIAGLSFLDMTKDEFREIGFALGPAKTLAKFVENLNETKLRSFSSYKTVEELKELLHEYKVNGDNITSIKQFNPNANEVTRCTFIESILRASIAVARREINKEIDIEY